MRLSEYCNNSDVIKRLEENDIQFKEVSQGLTDTLDYLATRYTVNLVYDYFTDRSGRYVDNALFKIYFDNVEIMWVWFTFGKKNRYTSIEINPLSIERSTIDLSSFDKIIKRTQRPQLKLEFTRYERVQETLKLICDAIEKYFNINRVDSINSPLRPKRIIRKTDGRLELLCGRCDVSFVYAPRCPECGQLVDMRGENND